MSDAFCSVDHCGELEHLCFVRNGESVYRHACTSAQCLEKTVRKVSRDGLTLSCGRCNDILRCEDLEDLSAEYEGGIW